MAAKRKPNTSYGRLSVGCESEKRQLLEEYVELGGSRKPFARFEAIVDRLDYRKVLLKDVYIIFLNRDGQPVEGSEDHVWMNEQAAKAFIQSGAVLGALVRFNAYAERYKRADGLSNIGLCRPCNIEVLFKPSESGNAGETQH